MYFVSKPYDAFFNIYGIYIYIYIYVDFVSLILHPRPFLDRLIFHHLFGNIYARFSVIGWF